MESESARELELAFLLPLGRMLCIMSFAVIETGSKQYKVSVGDSITIEKLPIALKQGDTVTFDKVLLLENGSDTALGTPYLEGKSVSAIFEGEGRGKKITVIHYKQKSRYFKKYGHRQPFMKVKIEKIG